MSEIYSDAIHVCERFLFNAGKFFLFLVFMFLTFTYFTFYGMMAVGLTPSQHLAAVISSAFYSLWNLLSGFLVPQPVSSVQTSNKTVHQNTSSLNLLFIFQVPNDINNRVFFSFG